MGAALRSSTRSHFLRQRIPCATSAQSPSGSARERRYVSSYLPMRASGEGRCMQAPNPAGPQCSGDVQARAPPRLGGRCGHAAAGPARNALVWRERSAVLDVVDELVERVLRRGLDFLELVRERLLIRLDVVPVLHLVEPVLGG